MLAHNETGQTRPPAVAIVDPDQAVDVCSLNNLIPEPRHPSELLLRSNASDWQGCRKLEASRCFKEAAAHDRSIDKGRAATRALYPAGDFLVRIGHGGRRTRRSARRARPHCLVGGIAGVFGVISGYYAPEPGDDRLDRLLRRSEQGRHRSGDGLGRVRHVRRRLGRVAAGLAGPDLRRRLVELRPPAARAHHRASSSASAAMR